MDHGDTIMVEREEMLDVRPFRVWLEVMVDRYGSIESAASHIGMTSRAVRRFVRPNKVEARQKRVGLDTVDAALQTEGTTFLWELYPDLSGYREYCD